MKIAGIQYLRAIAAIAVVFDHAAAMASFDKYFGEKAPFYDFWTGGGMGVNLFFVISGFIIVVSSFEPHTLAPRRRLGGFIVARAIRILPMMWLAIVSYAGLRMLGRGTFDVETYRNAMLLLPFGVYEPANMWTLRHEAIFYLVFGLAFLGWRRVWVLFALWLTLPFVLALVARPDPESVSWLEQSVANILSPVNILFGAGVLIGAFYRRFPDTIARLGRTPLVFGQHWWVLAILFALVMAFFRSNARDPVEVLATLPLFAAMVFLGCLPAPRVNRLVHYLGNASFSIYLFHPHFESALLGVMAKLTPGMPVMMVVVVVSVLATAIGCGIYSFVETPITRYLHGHTRQAGKLRA